MSTIKERKERDVDIITKNELPVGQGQRADKNAAQ